MINIQGEIKNRFLLQKEFIENECSELPLVSICVQTYNHEDYIEKCLNGILIQKTNFNYEIILGEDDSKDATRQICIKYAKQYPDKIRLFLRDRTLTQLKDENGNLIRRLNGIFTRMSAKGKYIAMCEGDDYWTDPLKLQKQVDFLETNNEYSFIVGGFKSIVYNDQKDTIIIKDNPIKNNPTTAITVLKGFDITLENAKFQWLTKTLTSMYKKDVLNFDVLNQYKHARDVHIFYHLLKEGKGFYIQEVLGVYNIHEGGIFSLNSTEKKLIDHFYLYQELYGINKDEFSRYMYLRMCIRVLNYKISYIRRRIEISSVSLFKEILRLLKTKEEKKVFLKAFIPLQIKAIKANI